MKNAFTLLLILTATAIWGQPETCMTPPRVAPIPAYLDADPLNGDYCVNVYLEVDYDIVQDKGGIQGARGYIDDLMGEVAKLYQADGITLNWEAFYWQQPSPYNGQTSGEMLNKFRLHRTNFDGDVAMLLSYRASGGIAYVDVLCSGQFGYSFSSIQPQFARYPTYSWSVMVIAHELGHNLGSPHTQSCVWNGNNTPIDGCYPAEGNCGTAPVPADGGTVMSYCHLKPVGINMSKGFGPQPLALIKNRIAGAGCVACTDGPEEPEPETCADNRLIMELQLDNYPQETSWLVTDADGNVVGFSPPYAKNQMNTYHADTLCLPDGCYTLIVDDVDGLGGYGCSEGLYVLNGPNGELSSGQVFAGSEITRFCLGEPSGCGKPNLRAEDFVSYANQDRSGTIAQEGGAVVLTGNTWKARPFEYTATSTTVITGEVWVETVGEIHGIGMVERVDNLAPSLTFRLAGTQRWGVASEQVETGSWQPFSIPVGASIPPITYKYLLLVNDHDPNGAIVTKWRNIEVCESGSGAAIQPLVQGLISDESVVEDIVLNPYPNPVSDTLVMPSSSDWQLYSIWGAMNQSGKGNLISMGGLRRGVYFLIQNGKTYTVLKE